MDEREMYAEMQLLIAAIARELGLSLEAAVQGLETGSISVSMGEEPGGERYLALAYEGRTARISQSALGVGGSCCCGGDGEGDEGCEEGGSCCAPGHCCG